MALPTAQQLADAAETAFTDAWQGAPLNAADKAAVNRLFLAMATAFRDALVTNMTVTVEGVQVGASNIVAVVT